MSQHHPCGVGLGLRWEILDEVLAAAPGELDAVKFFEISPENYMKRGGYIPDALERVAARHALVTHGLTMSLGGTDPLDAGYLAELRRFLSRFGADWHSDHLALSSHEGAVFHDLLPVPFTHATALRIADRVRRAQDALGRRVVVENVSYYVQLGQPELGEADFISEILERADCGLLLDLNNLDVNAANHRFDRWEWLARIPLERVVEIHVAGPEPWGDDLLLDTHGAPVRRSVHELLSWVIERTGPRPVLLERDNEVPPLATLLREVRQIDATYREALARRSSPLGRVDAA